MVLGVAYAVAAQLSTHAYACGQAIMWSRAINQVAARSSSCMRNEEIVQVACHQVFLIGLSFCFFNYIGWLTLPVSVIGGACLVPIFWASVYKAGLINVADFRQGMEVIVHASTILNVTAAALFVFAGQTLFGGVLSSMLILGFLRRSFAISLPKIRLSERLEFTVAIISAVLIGSKYHRLRALIDFGFRMRSSDGKTEAVTKGVAHFEGLTPTEFSGLDLKGLRATGEHIDWAAVPEPTEAPQGIQLDDYKSFAEEVCTIDVVSRMRDALREYDDYYREYEDKSDAEFAPFVIEKVAAWLEQIKRGTPTYEYQTEQTQIYASCILQKIKALQKPDQAYYLARLTWNSKKGVHSCGAGHIDVAEKIYRELMLPECATLQQRVAYAMQLTRRHLLHSFIDSMANRYPKCFVDPRNRHLVNLVLFVLNQRGIHLGLPEEITAREDTHYRGSLTLEPLIFYETRNFKEWFLKEYNSDGMVGDLIAVGDSLETRDFKEKIEEWILEHDPPVAVDQSISRNVVRIYQEDGITIKAKYYKAFLINMGILAPSEADITRINTSRVEAAEPARL